MLQSLLKLFRPQISRIRWWAWLLATITFFAWGFEWAFFQQAGPVSNWLVPCAFSILILTYFLQRRFWRLQVPTTDTTTKIAIIGAGPAGLSAAYFLRQQGYREVLVLEKLGRAGGLCRTITEDYRSFDLGANYVTPAYTETLKLADEVGAELYVERPIMTVDLRDESKPPEFSDPWTTVRQGMPAFAFIKLCLKYIWRRYRVGRIVNATIRCSIKARLAPGL